MAIANMLRHRCSIERATETDRRGVRRWTWDTIATDVPCSVQPTPAEKLTTFGRLGVLLTHTIYMARDFEDSINDKDRTRIKWEGRYYAIENLANTPMSDWPTVLDVRELPKGAE